MRVLVVHESMFGNTRRVAEAVAGTLEALGPVTVVVAGAGLEAAVARGDLVVVGAPTHARSLPRPATRQGAPAYVARSGGVLALEPAATGPGVREWLAGHPALPVAAAAFDTRLSSPAVLTGRASRRIGRELRRRGADVVGTESFVVDRRNQLRAGELDRAREWAEDLVALVHASALPRTPSGASGAAPD